MTSPRSTKGKKRGVTFTSCRGIRFAVPAVPVSLSLLDSEFTSEYLVAILMDVASVTVLSIFVHAVQARHL